MGGDGGPVADQGDGVRIDTAGAGEELVVRGPNRIGGFVESAQDGLQRSHGLAGRAQGGDDRGGQDGLADPGVGAGDEQAAHCRFASGAAGYAARATGAGAS